MTASALSLAGCRTTRAAWAAKCSSAGSPAAPYTTRVVICPDCVTPRMREAARLRLTPGATVYPRTTGMISPASSVTGPACG